MLLFLAKRALMLAREADESRKQMFLPTFAMEARSRKWWGNFKVRMSMYIEMFSATWAMNLHFFMSSSKFFPYLLANRMPPS